MAKTRGMMIHEVLPINLHEEMRRSYLDYALRVIEGRFIQPLGNTITNGMASGTICDGDADCSDATGADSAPAAADDDDGGDPDPEPERRRQHPPHPQAVAPTPARASERGTATATAGKSSPRIDPESELWRLPAVLAHVPISRSSWFAGVRSGRYPKPVRLSERRVAWRASDIRSFVAAL